MSLQWIPFQYELCGSCRAIKIVVELSHSQCTKPSAQFNRNGRQKRHIAWMSYDAHQFHILFFRSRAITTIQYMHVCCGVGICVAYLWVHRHLKHDWQKHFQIWVFRSLRSTRSRMSKWETHIHTVERCVVFWMNCERNTQNWNYYQSILVISMRRQPAKKKKHKLLHSLCCWWTAEVCNVIIIILNKYNWMLLLAPRTWHYIAMVAVHRGANEQQTESASATGIYGVSPRLWQDKTINMSNWMAVALLILLPHMRALCVCVCV